MIVYFGHLACCTSFDVFCDIMFLVRPPVILLKKLQSFGNSGVANHHRLMKKGCYSSPKFVVFHDNQCCAMVPVCAII